MSAMPKYDGGGGGGGGGRRGWHGLYYHDEDCLKTFERNFAFCALLFAEEEEEEH